MRLLNLISSMPAVVLLLLFLPSPLVLGGAKLLGPASSVGLGIAETGVEMEEDLLRG